MTKKKSMLILTGFGNVWPIPDPLRSVWAQKLVGQIGASVNQRQKEGWGVCNHSCPASTLKSPSIVFQLHRWCVDIDIATCTNVSAIPTILTFYQILVPHFSCAHIFFHFSSLTGQCTSFKHRPKLNLTTYCRWYCIGHCYVPDVPLSSDAPPLCKQTPWGHPPGGQTGKQYTLLC